MADRYRVSDLDFVYISYMEPNKEENWADLKNKVPWAKRVDGVKGFDSAHKAAAEVAETDFFISVDGDNIIDERFLLQTLDFTKTDRKAVHRWRAKNIINDLVYGNGGLVGWDKQTCLNMHTHENAKDKKAEIDFCWTVKHENLHNCYSTSVINSEPFQAWIAGYREGVKMSLNQGEHIKPEDFMKTIWGPNLRILSTWMTVGADVENGKYAMLGARMGCYSTTVDTNEWIQVRDLDKMLDYYENSVVHEKIDEDLRLYGESIRQRIDLPVAELDEYQSKFIKYIYPPHKNTGVQDREYK
tara:strand:- start:758 stop:1657 length:900 start_codon:yes stop_codon:yes gene_type:complete